MMSTTMELMGARLTHPCLVVEDWEPLLDGISSVRCIRAASLCSVSFEIVRKDGRAGVHRVG